VLYANHATHEHTDMLVEVSGAEEPSDFQE